MNKEIDKKTSHWIVNEKAFFDNWDYQINDRPSFSVNVMPTYIKAPDHQRTKKLEDLRKYANIEELEEGLFKDSNYKDPELSKSVWDYVHTMKIDDDLIVISTQSVPIILGVGKISSNYLYKKDSKDAKHIRDVQWSFLVNYGNIALPYHAYYPKWFVLRNGYLFNTEMFGTNLYNEIVEEIEKYKKELKY